MTHKTRLGAPLRTIRTHRDPSDASPPSTPTESSTAHDPSPDGSTNNKKGQITMKRLLTRREVEFRVGLARSTIYRLMRSGKFPHPKRIAGRAVRWPENELDAWIAAQPRSTDDDQDE